MDETKFFRKLNFLTFFYGQFLCWFTLLFSIWGLLNKDSDGTVEIIFFLVVMISALWNIKSGISNMGPIIFSFSRDLSKNEYGKLLEKVIHQSNSLVLGLIQPLCIGCIGIIGREMENSPYVLQYALFTLFLFGLAFVVLSYRITWCKNEFKRVTGQAFIGFY